MSHPAAAPSTQALDPDLFREAMSRLSAPVVLVTTDGEAGRHGLTVSAICSVSADPPTVLVCLNRSSRAHTALVSNGVLGISILQTGHEDIAGRFARSSLSQDEKFAGVDWHTSALGVPVLDNAVATLSGPIASIHSSGSHDIVLCQVTDITLREGSPYALAWFGRTFHSLSVEPA